MVDQNAFLETLNSVKEMIATAEVPMKEEEMLSYFQDMNLDGSQKAMVIDYLTNPDNYKEKEDGSSEIKNNTEEKQAAKEDEINVYEMYLEELEQLNKYSIEELDGFYKLLLQGDASVIEKISHAWLLRVTDIARQYMEPNLILEDLVQEGNVALLLKLSELCGSMTKEDVEELLNQAVEQGVMLYAGEMRDAREMEDTVVGKVNLVNTAKMLLTEEKNAVPSLKELAEYTKISEGELELLQDIINEAGKEQGKGSVS